MDQNKDGFVDFSEFVKGIRVPMCQKRFYILNEAFNKLDSNKDGILDVNDLRCWYSKLFKFSNKKSKISTQIEEVIFVEKCFKFFPIFKREK